MTRAVTLAEFADQSVFTADGNTNRVGIGTTLPTAKLEVDGTVDATSFTGSGSGLTGIVTTITQGTNISVSNSNGNVTISGLANTTNVSTDSIQVTGVSTIPTISGVTTFQGDVTFSKSISIGGTVTYEDVTNVDSIGIITARSGIVVSGGSTIAGVSTFYNSIKVGTGVTISTSGGITLNQTGNGNASQIINPLLVNYAEKVNAIGNLGTNATIDVKDGTYVTATLMGPCIFAFTSPSNGRLYGFALQLTNGGTGPHTITWPSTVKWPGSVNPPQRTETDGKTDIWSFFTTDGGTSWYGSISLYNFS